MGAQLTRRGAPALVLALLSLPCAAPAAAPEPAPAAAPAAEPEPASDHWPLPQLRMSGVLAYDLRREQAPQLERRQQGSSATVNLAANTYLWEPWFAQLGGLLGVTLSSDRSDGIDMGIRKQDRSKGLIVTGNARLQVLQHSAFPFEAHIERNHSKIATDLALGNAYTGSRVGFTQHYMRAQGDAMLGWDRNIQTDAQGASDHQDSLQLTMAQTIGDHRLQALGDATRNVRTSSGESATTRNLTLQHGYAADAALSVESTANISRSDYRLQQGDSRTGLVQLSSVALWRPALPDLTVMGGARLFALDIDSQGAGIDSHGVAARIRNANLNAGASYELSRFARLQASANLNRADNKGVATVTASQAASASYQPAAIALGETRYHWSANVLAAHRSGGGDSGQQLGTQWAHNLARMVALGNSVFSLEGGQSLSVAYASRGRSSHQPDPALPLAAEAGGGLSRQLTHSGSVSWSMAGDDTASAMLRLSASDTRALGGGKEYFQMVNLQATSNLVSGPFSSWAGNLTVQAVRQQLAQGGELPAPQSHALVATSGGSLSYQNQRLFGVPRLRFVSDLRLNSQALLPVLGKASDQETAAWENRIDYALGRAQLRLIAVVSRSPVQNRGAVALPGMPQPAAEQRINRALMVYLSRNFGNF